MNGNNDSAQRANSPVGSDVSELTVPSRSPSPVPDYECFLSSLSKKLFSSAQSDASELSGSPASVPQQATVVKGPESTDQPRSLDSRFVSRRLRRARSPSPDRSSKRPKRFTVTQQKASLRRARKSEPASPTSEPNSPMSWATGQGGFGVLEALPQEVRQEIYFLAFEVGRPVIVKRCCAPGKTKRERDNCPKHGKGTTSDAGRFNILQISKAMRQEAMFIVFGKGTLSLDTTNAIAPYVDGWRSTSMRGIINLVQRDANKSAIWNTASQFRTIRIDVPEDQVQHGNPAVFTDRLLGIATMLCKQQDQGQAAMKLVHVSLGSVFHQMLPFNMASQAARHYGELLDWMCVHSPYNEPDFDKLASEAAHNLQRLVSIIGKHAGDTEWKVFVKTQIAEKDKGGATALRSFQVACAKNDVVFEHLDDWLAEGAKGWYHVSGAWVSAQ